MLTINTLNVCYLLFILLSHFFFVVDYFRGKKNEEKKIFKVPKSDDKNLLFTIAINMNVDGSESVLNSHICFNALATLQNIKNVENC